MFAVEKGLRLIVIDFVLAFALIWTALFAVGFVRGRTDGAPQIAADSHAIRGRNWALHAPAPAEASYTLHHGDASRLKSYLLISLTSAALAALDLAFWRHLRRVYASPRRGRWRRG